MTQFILVFLFSCLCFAKTPDSYIAAHAVSTVDDMTLPQPQLDLLLKYKVITVGEIHGNDKSPLLARRLAEQIANHSPVILALEIRQENQIYLDEFLKTGDVSILKNSPHFTDEFTDGRSSRAMAELLSAVRENKKISIFAYDPDTSTNGQDRDLKMAANLVKISKERPDARIVMYGGNYHTSLKVGTSFNPTYHPAARSLYENPDSPIKESDIFPIKIRYHTGSSWMCYTDNAGECGAKDLDWPTAYSRAVSFDQYFLLEPGLTDDGYLSSFFIRSVEASPPLMDQK